MCVTFFYGSTGLEGTEAYDLRCLYRFYKVSRGFVGHREDIGAGSVAFRKSKEEIPQPLDAGSIPAASTILLFFGSRFSDQQHRINSFV